MKVIEFLTYSLSIQYSYDLLFLSEIKNEMMVCMFSFVSIPYGKIPLDQ